MATHKTLMFVVNVDWFFISHRLPIAIEAIKAGYSVHIATGLTDRREELETHGLVVHPLALDRKGAGLVNAFATMRQLLQLFRKVQPDLVHLVTIKPVLLGGLMARMASVPCVVAAVSGLGFVFMSTGWKSVVRRKLVGYGYRMALRHRNVRVIFQNPDDLAALSQWVHLRREDIALIRGSGVDLTRYVQHPLPSGVPVVMLAARLLADKGVGEFVQAARLLKQRGCSARFVLVGTVDPANPTSFTETHISDWSREGVVECWGHRADMQSVLPLATVVVLPSYREGLPKVLIEAAACGRAVVTTDVPGCRDAIDPGGTGWLVPPCDAHALADAISALLDDPGRCRDMGNAGRKLAEEVFDVQAVVARHLTIYEELMGKT